MESLIGNEGFVIRILSKFDKAVTFHMIQNDERVSFESMIRDWRIEVITLGDKSGVKILGVLQAGSNEFDHIDEILGLVDFVNENKLGEIYVLEPTADDFVSWDKSFITDLQDITNLFYF